MTLHTQVNALVAVPAWLRAEAEVAAIGSVKDSFDANESWPAARVERIGGQVLGGDSYRGERVMLQFTAVGGTRADAWQLAETIRAALVQRFHGEITLTSPALEFCAHKVQAGGLREGFDTTRPGADSSTTASGEVPAAKPSAAFDALITLTPKFAG